MTNRRKARKIQIGNIAIGATEPIAIQSMLSVPARDIAANITQAIMLENAGCQILRVAIPNKESLTLITALKEHIHIPLVADIHFDWRLAIEAVHRGIDKIRINPGNIGANEHVKAVAQVCNQNHIPIRIGVNSGSLEKSILQKHGKVTAHAMAESALYHVSLLEQYDFDNIVLSMKSNHVPMMMEAYKILAKQCDYPLHLGVTHTGTLETGITKSAIGIGGLLAQGIGDTLRVSLTAPPEHEIEVGKDILKALGLLRGVDIISCPTCGRCNTDVIGLTAKVADLLKGVEMPITVAVMGCVVNGPGEAKEADIGITGGSNGKCILFLKGEVLRTIHEDEILQELMKEIEILKIQKGE